MVQKEIIKVVISIALIVAGMLAIFIGFVVAIIVDSSWLLLSLVGLASIVIGIAIISSEAKRIKRMVKGMAPNHIRSRIKK